MRYPGSELYPEILVKNFKTLFFVDMETTGFDPWRNEILTLSMSAVDYLSMGVQGTIELTFKPKNLQFWGKGAEEVHGISVSKALYFEDKASATKRLIEFMELHSKSGPQILVCHAFDKYRTLNFYDSTMLRVHMVKMNLEARYNRCVRFFQSTETYFREARMRNYYLRGVDMFSFVDGRYDEEGENYKLHTLCAYYKIPLKHHDVKSDREGCQALYKIAKGLGTNEDEASFNLQEANERGTGRGGKEVSSLLHNDSWRGKDSNHRNTIDERVYFLQGEEE